jgi:hypothetical protein
MKTGIFLSWLEHIFYTDGVAGSSPVLPTIFMWSFAKKVITYMLVPDRSLLSRKQWGAEIDMAGRFYGNGKKIRFLGGKIARGPRNFNIFWSEKMHHMCRLA